MITKKQVYQTVKEMINDENTFKNFLKNIIKNGMAFHSYSLYNTLLIKLQRQKDVSLVAGFKKWNSLGRKIKAGEKAIKIYAPLIEKNNAIETNIDNEILNRETVKGFLVVNVFDYEQTEGAEIDIDKIMGYDSFKNLEDIYEKFKTYVTKQGVNIIELNNSKDTNEFVVGEYEKGTNNIYIYLCDKRSAGNKLITLAHEYFHWLFRYEQQKENRDISEIKTETATFIFTEFLNLNAYKNCNIYIQSYLKKLADPKIVFFELKSIIDPAVLTAKNFLQFIKTGYTGRIAERIARKIEITEPKPEINYYNND